MSKINKVPIVANGAIHHPERISALIRSHPFIVAADGGLISCDKMSIKPNLIVGDMDSTPSQLLTKYSDVPIKRFPNDKDKTDLEIAIELVDSPNVETISLFAALERRIDHTLY